MGIKNFHKWLKQNYPDAVSQITTNLIYFNNIYIDVNFALHRGSYNSTTLDTTLFKMYSFISQVLDEIILHSRPDCNPNHHTITFAADGPAPYAKIILQKERRLNLSRKKQHNKVNPICFTPGTIFMESLEAKMSEYLNSVKIKYNATIHTNMTGPDEAELKIMNFIKSRNGQHNNTLESCQKHIIVSNDADVILMACAINIPNIYVLTKLNGSKFEIISIDSIISSICAKNKIKYDDIESIGVDFTLLSLFIGDDYLPKISYVKFDKLWSCYVQNYNSTIVSPGLKYGICDKNGTINVASFIDFLRILAVNLDKKWINTFNIRSFNEDMYRNYLEGIQWCLVLYTTGKCSKYDYMYNYTLSPHPLGILYYLELCSNTIPNPIPMNKPIPLEIYPLLVIPEKDHNLINPEYVKKYFIKNKDKLKLMNIDSHCNKCDKYYKIINICTKQLDLLYMLNDTDIKSSKSAQTIEDSLKKTHVTLNQHKKMCHRPVTLNDLNNFITIMQT